MKTCAKCGLTQERSAFGPDKRHSDGLQSRCRKCRAADQAAYVAADPERSRRINRVSYGVHAAKRQAEARARYHADPEAAKRRNREWVEANREHYREMMSGYELTPTQRLKKRETDRAWERRNPDKVRARNARRYSLTAGAPDADLTKREWFSLMESFGDTCAYCGHRDILTMDHCVPVSRGGRHTLTNILPACQSCNSSKGSLTPLEWAMASDEVTYR